MLLALKANDN